MTKTYEKYKSSGGDWIGEVIYQNIGNLVN